MNTSTESASEPLTVTPDTRISDVLERYGDIVDVMQALGVKPVGRFSVRRVLSKAVTVRRAALVHRLSVDDMVRTLQTAINQVHARDRS